MVAGDTADSAGDPDGSVAVTALGIFLRGMLMGAADIVPGVSGGTMAFITGIYDRLLAAIAAFDLGLLPLLRRRDWRGTWRHVDGSFLLLLVGGILLSVFSLARLITFWLETQPLLLWSFFFGLILASALLLLRRVSDWHLPATLGLSLGAALAALLGLVPALSLPPVLASFFFAGFVAICAMILPGISGSFILVLLGMYAPVLEAIETLRLPALLLFAVGAGLGLLLFSRLLHYLLVSHHGSTLATLTGFLVGSLLVVWPWKLPRQVGEELLMPVLPAAYAAAAGDPRIVTCVLLMALGFAAVWLLENRWGGPER
jgi:putative membrane protein